MRKALTLVRWFVGLLFIFSGLIKINDPSGFGFKLEEYFEIFGTEFLVSSSLYLAVFTCILEVVLGIALLMKIKMVPVIWSLLLLIIFFTFLTGYSAITNEVTDCGCFGDAIKLTPWQSFTKDCILLLLILVLFYYKKVLTSSFTPKLQNIVVGSGLIICLALALYCYNFLPVIDFLKYKTGTDIIKGRQNSSPLIFEYVYSKNGKKFHYSNIMDAPYSDSTYHFDTSIVANPSAIAKLLDYYIADPEGQDYTSSTLTGNKLFILMYDINRANLSKISKIVQLTNQIKNQDMDIMYISGSGKEKTSLTLEKMGIKEKIFFADPVFIKSMIRSNPGLILIKNGIIRGKWHYNHLPSKEQLLLL